MFFTPFQIHTVPHSTFYFLFFLLHFSHSTSDDRHALLALKSSIDKSDVLQWQNPDPCNWTEVKQCTTSGKVTKLVIERSNLSGFLETNLFGSLDQLRLLSLKSNYISGQIPDLSPLVNLKSLFLDNNNFSGSFPPSFSTLHRLKVLVLAGNRISGSIPPSLVNLRRLHTLYLEGNLFVGGVPPLNQTTLRFLNLSGNNLCGIIPSTSTLLRFNHSSFAGNPQLCGVPVHVECHASNSSLANRLRPHDVRWVIAVTAGVLTGMAMMSVFLALGCLMLRRRRGCHAVSGCAAAVEVGGSVEGTAATGGDGGKEEGEEGRLVFFDGEGFGIEELMKASAEAMGRGRLGSTYKAAMESGVVVTVKRLRAVSGLRGGEGELGRQVEMLGRMSHPNLVRLRAYFQTREECLLVLDYFPNGSVFSLIHGTGGRNHGKPLHWTSCLKISEDTTAALLHIHTHSPGLAHGSLKSSNVLFGPDFESCLTDYGLAHLADPPASSERVGSVPFPAHWAPECRRSGRPPCTQAADVYSFGVLLLELLTGRTPPLDLLHDQGGVVLWARSVRDEECESSSGSGAHEGKTDALLGVAVACLHPVAEDRPDMAEVVTMVRGVRLEAAPNVSSNSSCDHSPGRWSDTVQSLPREEHLTI